MKTPWWWTDVLSLSALLMDRRTGLCWLQSLTDRCSTWVGFKFLVAVFRRMILQSAHLERAKMKLSMYVWSILTDYFFCGRKKLVIVDTVVLFARDSRWAFRMATAWFEKFMVLMQNVFFLVSSSGLLCWCYWCGKCIQYIQYTVCTVCERSTAMSGWERS